MYRFATLSASASDFNYLLKCSFLKTFCNIETFDDLQVLALSSSFFSLDCMDFNSAIVSWPLHG
jgi:hypothetical protein